MSTLPTLHTLARQQNIAVLRYPMAENGSMSLELPEGRCVIGMDEGICDGGAQELTHLAHELGHCLTGSFYSIHTVVDCRQRHENRADKWAVRQLIPEEALDEAVAEGCTEIWALAERFGVTETFMRKAVCLHVHGNVATELYF